MASTNNISSWAHNEHTRIKRAELSNYTTWAVVRIPRWVFRKCGISFRERTSNVKSQYYEMCMHLFLEMARQLELSGRDQKAETIVDVFPYIKMYIIFYHLIL